MNRMLLYVLAVVAFLISTSCSKHKTEIERGGGAVSPASTPTPSPTPAPSPTPTPSPTVSSKSVPVSSTVTITGVIEKVQSYGAGAYDIWFSSSLCPDWLWIDTTSSSATRFRGSSPSVGLTLSVTGTIEAVSGNSVSGYVLTDPTGNTINFSNPPSIVVGSSSATPTPTPTPVASPSSSPSPSPSPSTSPAPVAGSVTVTLHESSALVPNPGMGWMTFDEPGQGGFDPNNPTVPTTIFYHRPMLSDLTNADGTPNFSDLDETLQLAHANGQRVMLQIMPFDDHTSAPRWLTDVPTDINGNVASYALSGPGVSGTVIMPNLDNLNVQAKIKSFMDALASRYANNPDMNGQQEISLLLMWGEGHIAPAGKILGPMPSDAAVKWLVDLHYNDFPNFSFIGPDGFVGTNGTRALDYMYNHYGASRGAGMFANCWGQYTGSYQPMNPAYTYSYAYALDRMTQLLSPLSLNPAGDVSLSTSNLWKSGAIKLEPCGTMASWPTYIPDAVQWAVDNHASFMSDKYGGVIPSGYTSYVLSALKQMGYRIVINQVTHPSKVSVGTNFSVRITGANKGNAPSYDNFIVALQLRNGSQTITLPSSFKIKNWLPGSIDQTLTFSIPSSASPGSYTLAIGIVDPKTVAPKVKLADTEAQDAEGWYPISVIQLQ